MVYEAIKGLVEYGLKAGLITEADRIYVDQSDSGCNEDGPV